MNEQNKNPEADQWQEQIQDLEMEGTPNRGFTAKHNHIEKQANTVNREKTNPPKHKDALKAISIKLPPSLLEDLTVLADQDNIGYQTFIKQILRRYVRDERLKRKPSF